MNTIDDLRATLQHHAADLPDELDHARGAAVHQRVRVARQRRRQAVAGGIAAAVALTVGAVNLIHLPSSPSPADQRTLAGFLAPDTMSSLGFGYRFEQGSDGSGTVTLRLPASDQPRLISWAGSTAGEVSVVTPDRQLTSDQDFADFTTIYGGESGDVTVTGPGEVAVAVYTLDELAPGIAQDGVVFRDQVAAAPLLGAAFGDTADPISLEVTTPTGRIRVAAVCRNAPAGAWLRVAIDGDLLSSGECFNDWFVDAGASSSGTFDGLGGESHTITATVTQGQDGPAIEAPGLEYGVGAYAEPLSIVTGPFDVSPEVEYDGHTWVYGELDTAAAGRGRFAVTLTRGPVYVVAHHARMAKGALVEAALDGTANMGFAGGGTGSGGLGVGQVGDRVTITVDGEPGPDSRLGIATYTRSD